jgi:hypothetical protein
MFPIPNVTTLLSPGVKLTKDDCPTQPEEVMDMKQYPYQSLIGTLMYAMFATCPDIAFAVGILSCFSSNPGKVHWDQALHVLGYLLQTHNHCLEFDGSSDEELTSLILGYSDSDWAGDVSMRWSTGGYIFLMCNAAISWSRKLQATSALSSTKAEYMALTHAAQAAIWLHHIGTTWILSRFSNTVT